VSIPPRTTPGTRERHHRSTLRIILWVVIVVFYLLGVLSLVLRSQFDIGAPLARVTPVGEATLPIATAQATASLELPTPEALTPTPFPTLTPRTTLYPTLTPRP